RTRLDGAERRVLRRHPNIALARGDERLRQTFSRMLRAMHVTLGTARAQLGSRADRLTACAPQRVLARGYSITRDARTRRILQSVSEIREAQRLITQLADGEFRSTAEDPRQPGLFDDAP
ncbi:MAG: hypothetical protein D6744_14050, partial [Planctomycetota bacterium]